MSYYNHPTTQRGKWDSRGQATQPDKLSRILFLLIDKCQAQVIQKCPPEMWLTDRAFASHQALGSFSRASEKKVSWSLLAPLPLLERQTGCLPSWVLHATRSPFPKPQQEVGITPTCSQHLPAWPGRLDHSCCPDGQEI